MIDILWFTILSSNLTCIWIEIMKGNIFLVRYWLLMENYYLGLLAQTIEFIILNEMYNITDNHCIETIMQAKYCYYYYFVQFL